MMRFRLIAFLVLITGVYGQEITQTTASPTTLVTATNLTTLATTPNTPPNGERENRTVNIDDPNVKIERRQLSVGAFVSIVVVALVLNILLILAIDYTNTKRQTGDKSSSGSAMVIRKHHRSFRSYPTHPYSP